MRRGAAIWFWRIVNPAVKLLAGIAPWWVLLETTGRKSRLPRRLPLATGPRDGNAMLLVAVNGEQADFVRNIAAQPRVRLKVARRWRTGTAEILPLDDATLRRFNLYARTAERVFVGDARLIRLTFDD